MKYEHNNLTVLKTAEEPENQKFEYKMDDEKRVFIVTPIYFADSGKTIYDVLFSLMTKHGTNH